uniref:Uncharacterized protein n=1 Tax=Cacopsylla melanoneura TaxID=428564 RepID=A0A8D8QKA6_9HEMI
MAANHHTRVVSPQQHNVMISEVKVLVQPILQRQIGEDVAGLGDEDRLLNFGLIHVNRGAGLGRVVPGGNSIAGYNLGGNSTARYNLELHIEQGLGELDQSGFDETRSHDVYYVTWYLLEIH